MSDLSIEQLTDRYISGEASAEEIELLATRLETDDCLVSSLVETASLEAILEGLSKTNTTISTKLQTQCRLRSLIVIAGSSAIAVAILLWANTHRGRGDETRHATAVSSGLDSERYSDKASILPKPSPRRSEFSADAMQRLENYILPTLDLRGLTVPQSVSKIEQVVEELGFDETAEPMPEFIGMVMFEEGAVSNRRVPLFRDDLRLLPTLRYLAALEGRRLAFEGTSIVRKASQQEELPSTRTVSVPPNFFTRSAAPDFRTTAVQIPDEETSDADLDELLQAWGVPDLNGEAIFDRKASAITLTQTPTGFRILTAATELFNQVIKRVHLKSKILQLPVNEAQGYPVLAQLDDLSVLPPDALEEVRLLTEIADESETIQLIHPTTVVTKSNFGYSANAISTVNNQEPPLDVGFNEEPPAEAWWGVTLRFHPTVIGEKIALDFDWEMRGKWLSGDPQGLAVYDGLVQASEETVFPPYHGVLIKRPFKQQDSTSTVVLVIEGMIIDPRVNPNRPDK